ncbi:hypothetical protein MO867_21335 [Microbulbifer sp. OS29]|uniref:Holin of 3TMs, for gene-transfer release n=1 Tax=Microbulbifer okhotskensis TaxID=2926617 RepID=A0A9X2ESW7_9GAMM|nr:hypothetical protein [Microbulbifer okhotskensis]MCO1336875.1 hypothetical protein [Microbulbifer okhotskensis]
MGIWSGVKGLFAGPESAGKVLDATVNTVDAVWFTSEEKSRWYLKYLEATQPQNRARRLIAFLVTLVWALLVLFIAAAMALKAPFVADLKGLLVDVVVQPYSIIIGFYFVKSWVSEVKR